VIDHEGVNQDKLAEVTNAIQHTKSGVDGGTVTIVVIGVPHGVLVEIIDDGSAGTPVVKGDLYAAEGPRRYSPPRLDPADRVDPSTP
jgi:anti-sigma regulatory factor (Ser/Thr protein kinase)